MRDHYAQNVLIGAWPPKVWAASQHRRASLLEFAQQSERTRARKRALRQAARKNPAIVAHCP